MTSAQNSRSGHMPDPSLLDSEDSKEFFTLLRKFSSEAGHKRVLDNVTLLQRQLQGREDELVKVKNEMLDQGRRKDIAIDEMFQANEKEKTKQKQFTLQVEELQKTIKEKEKGVTERETKLAEVTGQLQKLRTASSKAAADLTQAQKDIEGMQERLKDQSNTIDNLKLAESKLQGLLSATKGKMGALEGEGSTLRKSLRDTQTQLRSLEGFTAGYYEGDEDEMLDSFASLWEYATTEIYAELKKDLSQDVLQDRLLWESFRYKSNLAVQHRVPIPSSNSPAAKQMRLAVILAILAREIDRLILQPTYLLPEDTHLREILAGLAAHNEDKESFCRSMLLSIDPEVQARTLQSRVEVVVRNVSSYLFNMLPQAQYTEVRLRLEKVVKKAVQVWQPIQRAKRRYEPDFEPLRWGDDESTPFVFPNSAAAGSRPNQNTRDESLLMVFPRIAAVEKGGRFPLTFVVQLTSSQPPCVAARQEEISSSPSIGRVTSNRSRRRSNASGNATSVNGVSPSLKKAAE